MIGAIIGDIVGSPYEFDWNNIKTTDFPLFSGKSHFTDDSVMTIAVAEAVMAGYEDEVKTAEEVVKSMQKWGRKYPNAGYGGRFGQWVWEDHPQPYDSFGNGSAMRVAPVGWLYDSLADVEKYAEITARVTHDHPEGIKGAKAVASVIFLARRGHSKDVIRRYVTKTYGYDLSRTCNEIRPAYRHVESCQETVPEAITAFLEGNSFEEVLRLAVSLGGDSDTLTAIAASMAEAMYPIPDEITEEAVARLDNELLAVLIRALKF